MRIFALGTRFPKAFFHPSFLAFLGLVAIQDGLVASTWILAASWLHEFVRAKTAEKVFDGCFRDTIYYPGAAEVVHPHPLSPFAHAVSAVAGPLSNLAAAWLLGRAGYPLGANANGALGLVTLLPVLPLAGGRAVWALLVPRLGHGLATRVMVGWSRGWAVPFLLAAPATRGYSLVLAWVVAFKPTLVAQTEEGCLNSQGWFDMASELARSGRPCWVAALDADHCERYRIETGGTGPGFHSAFPAFAAMVAAWRVRLGEGAVLGKYGADEFALIWPCEGEDEARTMAELLRTSTPPPLTVSIGLVRASGDLRLDLRRGERAVATAKAQGRNRTVAWSPGMDPPGPP